MSYAETDYLWPHLKALPAFRALIRAIEARLLAGIDLSPPVLDIGCGDGHFVEASIGHADVGLDPDPPSLREAQDRGVYRMLTRSPSVPLPFADASFQTVLSNSTLEHIADLDGTLKEIYRVLRPAGRFVFCVPTDSYNPNLGVPFLLRKIGLTPQAQQYEAWFSRIQRHYHMYSPETWQEKMTEHGLTVVWSRGYLSRRATHLFDLAHYLGVPNLVARKLTGRWVPFPWRPLFAPLEAICRPLYEEEDGVSGSTWWFAMATKGEPVGDGLVERVAFHGQ